MSRHFKKFFAFSLSLSMIFPISTLHARFFDLREQAIYSEAFVEFVDNYKHAEVVYHRQGPEAFINQLLPIDATKSDREYLRKVLGGLPQLPKLSSESALLIIDATHLGAGVHTIEVSNIDDGLLIVDGNPVEFDPATKDLESISKKIQASFDRSTMRTSWLNSIEDMLLPKAQASVGKAALWVLLGALGGVATSWVWGKWKNRGTTDRSLEETQGAGVGH
jgi:hypothetical protein